MLIVILGLGLGLFHNMWEQQLKILLETNDHALFEDWLITYEAETGDVSLRETSYQDIYSFFTYYYDTSVVIWNMSSYSVSGSQDNTPDAKNYVARACSIEASYSDIIDFGSQSGVSTTMVYNVSRSHYSKSLIHAINSVSRDRNSIFINGSNTRSIRDYFY